MRVRGREEAGWPVILQGATSGEKEKDNATPSPIVCLRPIVPDLQRESCTLCLAAIILH